MSDADRLEYEKTRSWFTGQASGLEKAAKYLFDDAKNAFIRDQDDYAYWCREKAKALLRMADDRRKERERFVEEHRPEAGDDEEADDE